MDAQTPTGAVSEVALSRGQLTAMVETAAALGRSGRREDAVAAVAIYRRLVGIRPRDAVLAYNLATTLLSLGDYAEGFRCYEARAYLGMRHVVKPEYRPVPLPLSPTTPTAWGQQTLDAASIAAFLRAPVSIP